MIKPLISVVLPVYNVEPYIKDCMDSILNQTIKDFEVIVIDDCSTDSTVAVVESYNDDRISIIKKEKNKGLIDSLNLGFRLAKGKYIARVDGDDINVLNRFEKQLLFLESNPDVDLCGTWANEFDGNERVLKYKESHNQIVAELLIKSPICHPSVMLRRERYLSFSFDKSKNHVEDYDFWARTAWDCKMHNLQEVLYYYRVHGKQVSSLYNHIQKEGDFEIKVSLFKKLNYNTKLYTDDFLEKIIYTNNYITVRELYIFLKWINILLRNNNKTQIFHPKYLKEVLNNIINNIVYKIFFVGSRKNIDKLWRVKAFMILPVKEKIFVMRKKLIF